MKYRAEIDGLRALAVLPVIFFHAGFQLFSGGYVGVDVFFVISGYLITSILIGDLKKDRFSILHFYEKRARRILPALIFVVVCFYPFAWIYLSPEEMAAFSKSLIAVGLFISNFFFWKESGYFSPDAETFPLLHTWSLAVEEQYYLLFPIFLFLTWKLGKKRIFWMICIIAVSSLVLSEIGYRKAPTANFYLPFTRTWELLAGSICALIIVRRGIANNQVLATFGLLAILFSIFFYDVSTPFPSLYAIVPVAGVSLIILYGGAQTFVAKVLSLKAFVSVGLISYSAYLWHHPLFVVARLRSDTHPNAGTFLALSILSLVLAFLSWRFIEGPFRNRNFLSRRTIFTLSGLGLLLMISVGVLGIKTQGFEKQRYSQVELAILNPEVSYDRNFQNLGNLDKIEPKWMLLGDSHARALQGELDKALIAAGGSAIVKVRPGCPPALELLRFDMPTDTGCDANYLEALSEIENLSIENVILTARFTLYLNSERYDDGSGGKEGGEPVFFGTSIRDSVVETSLSQQEAIENKILEYVEKLQKLDVDIFIIRSTPEAGWNVPKKSYLNEKFKTGEEVKISLKRYLERRSAENRLMIRLESLPNVKIIDPLPAFCDDTQCFATQDGAPLFGDTNHLSNLGAKRVIRLLPISSAPEN